MTTAMALAEILRRLTDAWMRLREVARRLAERIRDYFSRREPPPQPEIPLPWCADESRPYCAMARDCLHNCWDVDWPGDPTAETLKDRRERV